MLGCARRCHGRSKSTTNTSDNGSWRNTLGFDEWIELDLKYIRERRFLTNWRILFGTFRAVFGMNGE